MAAAILDVDGTLVDSNYQHAIAWYRAFREHDLTPPVWRIHRHIGMGGDQLVAAVAGDEVERESGDSIREAEKRLYAELIDEVSAFEGARELIDELKRPRSRRRPRELGATARRSSTTSTCSTPASSPTRGRPPTTSSGPSPRPTWSRWRCRGRGRSRRSWSATRPGTSRPPTRAELKTIAVLTGGFSEAELLDAGAVAVFESLVDAARAASTRRRFADVRSTRRLGA